MMTHHAADTRKGPAIAALIGTALLWSIGGLFIKIVAWNPLALAGMRSLIGGLLILAYMRRPRFTWSFPQIAGALAYAATMICFVAANKLTAAANVIVLQYMAPVYLAFLGAWFLKERTHWYDWITIAVVLGGMVLFFVGRLSPGNLWGNVLAVASGVLFALSTLFLRMQKDGSPLESLLLGHGFTVLAAIPFFFLSPAPTAGSWAGIAVLGVFQIGISSILFSYGIRHVTALESLLTTVLEPIFNPVWVFLALGEMPAPLSLVGAVVILSAVTARSLLSIASVRRAPQTR